VAHFIDRFLAIYDNLGLFVEIYGTTFCRAFGKGRPSFP
jgi:hypothetical protein